MNGISGVRTFLHDNYTAAKTELFDGENEVAFSVDAAITTSVAANRFDIVFEDQEMLAVDNLSGLGNVKIYPNPITENQFFLKLPTTVEVRSVKIINILGQEVYAVKPVLKDGTIEIKPNTILKIGVYRVWIDCGKNSFKRKVIVK